MKASKWTKILSAAGYICLAGCALALALSPFFDIIGKNLAAHTWIGIFCGILAAFVGYFQFVASYLMDTQQHLQKRLDEVATALEELAKSRDKIKHLTLMDAVKHATTSSRYIKHLRIYASTTAVILPIVRDQRLSIEQCDVMIQTFAEDDPNPNAKSLNERCDDMAEGWKELAANGHIKKLRLVRYNRYPSEYVMVVDSSFLIHGLYAPSDKSKHGSDYYHPFVVEATQASFKTMIEDYAKWFDKQFAYFYSHTNMKRNS